MNDNPYQRLANLYVGALGGLALTFFIIGLSASLPFFQYPPAPKEPEKDSSEKSKPDAPR